MKFHSYLHRELSKQLKSCNVDRDVVFMYRQCFVLIIFVSQKKKDRGFSVGKPTIRFVDFFLPVVWTVNSVDLLSLVWEELLVSFQ